MNLIERLRDFVLGRPRRRVDLVGFFGGCPDGRYVLAQGGRAAWDCQAQERLVHISLPEAPDASELARPWLRHCVDVSGTKRTRIPWSNDQFSWLSIPQPLHLAQVGELRGEWAMVDIEAAYYSIYSALSLDLEYKRDRGTMTIRDVAFDGHEQIAPHKLARNMAAGIIRSTHRTIWEGGTVHEERSHNTLLAPQLWALIADTMHAIARRAVEGYGAVFVNTDGYIVPAGHADGLITELADDWCLKASVRASGKAALQSYTSYQVGDHTTETNHQEMVPKSNLVDLSSQQVARLARLRRFAL